MRKLRKAALIASSVLAMAACGSPASAALTTPTHNSPNHTSTVTYAFYSTATGSEAPTNQVPAGWMFNDNTDFEADNPIACESAYLGNITEYLCTVPRAQAPDDTSYDVTFTDDGDMLYSNDPNQDILDPFAGGSPNGRLLPSERPVTD